MDLAKYHREHAERLPAMKAKIVVTTTYRFTIQADEYAGLGVKSWQDALDYDIREGTYEDFGDFDRTVEGQLTGDSVAPWPEPA